LAEQIEVLQAKRLGRAVIVDLYFKLALPFSGMVAVTIGFAVILRTSHRGSLASNVGVAMGIVFAYWATMAVTVSAGHAGNLPRWRHGHNLAFWRSRA
jgi:lipopolysaccharide export LptBFGC system permease protein LptF